MESAEAAVADIPDGASLAVGGFGLFREPDRAHRSAPRTGHDRPERGEQQLRVDGLGLGVLLAAQRIRKMTSSYVGENKEFERQFLSGELELS
ncbi:CoA-transferase [Microbacterium sp. NRRL B-14842]|uniref:CoA-transferase n=1 Tax=Microbacterium sp. NRRL B-14842 TaxID=3162881 RepID=UPI003D2E79E8